MNSDTQGLNMKAERTRRNIMRMGVVGATTAMAMLTSSRKGMANPGNGNGWGNGDGGGRDHNANCFLKGAAVTTASGDRKVEELAIGDLLPTMFGGTRPIQWIGRFPIKRSDPSKPWPKEARPVRIARSALAPNVPQADLYVTQAHGVFVDDVLVSAGHLVNGTTITLCDISELSELEFFHIKLENHDVIYVEGAPVESLLNVDESAVNFADYFRMYGMPAGYEAPCVPFLSNWRRGGLRSRLNTAISWNGNRRRIAAIRDRLKQRAIALSQELEPAV
jgi:hypothetical protein